LFLYKVFRVDDILCFHVLVDAISLVTRSLRSRTVGPKMFMFYKLLIIRHLTAFANFFKLFRTFANLSELFRTFPNGHF